MLRIALVALLVLSPLAPASAQACPPAASDASAAYAPVGSDRHAGVRVLGAEYREEVFLWPSVRSADLWLESNGLEGLQTEASACGPADTHVVGASAGVGRPSVIV